MWNRLFLRLMGRRLHIYTFTGDLLTRWCHLRSSLPCTARNCFDLGFAATCWELWKERNARLFGNRLASSGELEGRVFSLANFWATTRGVVYCVLRGSQQVVSAQLLPPRFVPPCPPSDPFSISFSLYDFQIGYTPV